MVEFTKQSLSNATAVSHLQPRITVHTASHVTLDAKEFQATPDGNLSDLFCEGSYGGPTATESVQDAKEMQGDQFAYAMPNRPGSQAAYVNHPHTLQRTVPRLLLPHSRMQVYGNEPFYLPRPAFTQGDLVFSLRLEASNPVLTGLYQGIFASKKSVAQEGSKSGALVSLRTINYILHGIQVHRGDGDAPWSASFCKGFGLDMFPPDCIDNDDGEALCTHVVRNCLSLVGVVTAHDPKRAINTDDETISMVIDGHAKNVGNLWSTTTAAAGVNSGGGCYTTSCPLPGGGGVGKRKRQSDGGGGGGSAWSRDGNHNRYLYEDDVQAGDDLILILRKIPVKDVEAWCDLDEIHRVHGGTSCDVFTHVLPGLHSPHSVKMKFKQRDHVWMLVPSIRTQVCV